MFLIVCALESNLLVRFKSYVSADVVGAGFELYRVYWNLRNKMREIYLSTDLIQVSVPFVAALDGSYLWL